MIVPSKAKKFQKLPGREQVKREDNSKPANGYRGGGLGEKEVGEDGERLECVAGGEVETRGRASVR